MVALIILAPPRRVLGTGLPQSYYTLASRLVRVTLALREVTIFSFLSFLLLILLFFFFFFFLFY